MVIPSPRSICSTITGTYHIVAVIAIMPNRVLMVGVFWLFVSGRLGHAYSPSNSAAQQQYAVGDIFPLAEHEQTTLTPTTTKGVGKIKKEGPILHRLQASTPATPVASQDISNGAPNGVKGKIILAPKAFNIFKGNTWTTARRNMVDNFAANVGNTDYWKILKSQTDGPTGKSCADLEFKGSVWDNTLVGLIGIKPTVADTLPLITSIFQTYVTAKKVQTAGDFDLQNFDLANTIFTLYLGTGYHASEYIPYCGWHSATYVTYNNVKTQIFISLVVVGSPAFGCLNFAGQTVGQGGTTLVDTTSPNNE